MPRPCLAPLLARALVLTATLCAAVPCLSGELRPVDAAPAPALELPDLGGATRRLDDWRGQVVLLNFWAGWCQPCVAEMPGIQRLATQMRGRPFAVVTVNVAETQRRVEQTVARLGLDFPVLLDADGTAFKAWGGKGLPTSVLVDRTGALRYIGLGPLEWDGGEAATTIEGLLEQGTGGEEAKGQR